MEKPTPAAIAAFDQAFPADDERAVRKKMFGIEALEHTAKLPPKKKS